MEVMVVLVLMALVSGTAALAMHQRLRRADQTQVVAALEALDQRARYEAGLSDCVVSIVIDSDRRSVVAVADIDGRESVLDRCDLPPNLRVQEAWVLHHGKRLERDPLTVGFNRDGSGPTYGLTLAVEASGGDEARIAVVFIGACGQMLVFEDEDEVHDILSAVTRHDAG
jgi:Tfp pilus assembly protein FimT